MNRAEERRQANRSWKIEEMDEVSLKKVKDSPLTPTETTAKADISTKETETPDGSG